MNDEFSKAEIGKDAVQGVVEAAAGAIGQVATIVTAAVKDVAEVLGGFATEVFEIRESARRATEDAATDAATDAEPEEADADD